MADLTRFLDAQNSPVVGFADALAELHAGEKIGHWIWYVFPQLAGLGRSPAARHFAIADLTEAMAYLADPVLRARYRTAAAAVAQHLPARPLDGLMGSSLDAMKLVSSLTLFQLAARALDAQQPDPELAEIAATAEAVLRVAAEAGYPRCAFTAARIVRVDDE